MLILILFALNNDNYDLELEFVIVFMYGYIDCYSWIKLKIIKKY